MFSNRLPWHFTQNRIADLLQEKRRSGKPVLDLTESNPTSADVAYPGELLSALVDERSLRYEPEACGLASARRCVARYYAALGVEVAADRIILTSSTSEAYSWLFKLLADPGDEILAPRPSYPLFEFLASLESVRVVPYPLHYVDGTWMLDLHALSSAVTGRARAIVIVNPNNPTGSYVKQHELEELNTLCARHGLALISDEVFSDYSLTEDSRRISTAVNNSGVLTFSLNGLSKLAALPQMKLGWIAVSGPENLRAPAWDRLEVIADTYLSVGTPVQHALKQFLEIRPEIQSQIRGRTSTNLAHLRRTFQTDSAAHVLSVEGGWNAVLQLPRTRTEEDWVLAMLSAHDTLVQPGFYYDFESEPFLILSLLTHENMFREGVRLLAGAITLYCNPS